MTPLISFTTKEAGYFGRDKVLTWILTINDILEQAIDPNWKPRLIEKPDVSLKCINAFFFFFSCHHQCVNGKLHCGYNVACLRA